MFLKQSTAVVICFGPFLDKTDGVSLKAGLAGALDHASTGIMLSKNGGALTIRHATVTASTYDAHGCYRVTLDAMDTGALGNLRVIYTDATTCLPVWQDFQIVVEVPDVPDIADAVLDALATQKTTMNRDTGDITRYKPDLTTPRGVLRITEVDSLTQALIPQ
jgi:hypothetical protein